MPEAVFFVLDAPVRSMVAIQSDDPPLLHSNHRVFWVTDTTISMDCRVRISPVPAGAEAKFGHQVIVRAFPVVNPYLVFDDN